MTSHGIARHLLNTRGYWVALLTAQNRADTHRATVRRMETSGRFAGIARYMARRMVWDAVAQHLRATRSPNHS